MSVKSRLLVLAVTVLAALAVAPTASAAVDYRGVQLHSLWSSSSDENMARELDLVRNLGANAVRVDIAWSSLQTTGPNEYSDWYVKKLDAFVAGAEARGMKVIANLWSTPCWASSAPETLKQGCKGSWWERDVTKYMPVNPLDYARSAQWLTARYGTKLAALEVWNEPNHENFLTAVDPAAAYALMVKATYPLAKAGNPNVPVLAGALSFADRGFLERLYSFGIKGSYDGISVHPYNEWRAPGDMWDEEWKRYTLIPGLRSIRAAQQAVGDNTPVWITEFGWTNCTGGDRWCVSTEQQASYLHDSFARIDAEPYVKSAIVYNLRDKGTDRSYTEDNFGLMTRDYTPKPAYGAVRAAWTGNRPQDGGLAAAERHPAKLKVERAGVRDGRLDVLVNITGRADGELKVEYHAAGQKTRFTVEIEDRYVRIDQRLPASQRSRSTGIVTLTYAGNEDVRSDEVRVRAARGKALLKRRTAAIDNGRLEASGGISERADGVVRLRLGYVNDAGELEYLSARAEIDDGTWKVSEPLPAAAARSGGQLSIQFTGLLSERMRGEQDSKQVLPHDG